ncbi:MAG TPA: hypothetical protein VFL41_03680 [Gaiellaceae bacterium]|nr:hypothetical protein [Gaiellaceae bacterium]
MGDPAPSEAADPAVEPGDQELISSLLGQIGGDDECGNTNISFRVSSPGDDSRVKQITATGECGRNIVVTIRINSPGDNGPVSQTVGTMDAIISHFSALVHARQRRLGLAQAGQPSQPVVVDPTTLPGRLERNARQLAWSLVAQAQARANRALPQAAPPRARERSRSSVKSRSSVRVTAYASSSGGAARVAVSARVSIKASHRVKRARGRTSGASVTIPRSREGRLAASPLVVESKSAGGSGSGRGAVLVALLAALVGAYLLVPPLRSAHALGVSRFWPKRGETPR